MKINIRRRPWLSEENKRRSTCELKINPSNKWTDSNTWGAISVAHELLSRSKAEGSNGKRSF